LFAVGQKLKLDMASLQQRNAESNLLAEMGDLLLACRTADEAYPIIARYARRLMPAISGSLYLVHDSGDMAERVGSWGVATNHPGERELALNECWALRRGRMHIVTDISSEPLCGHILEPMPQAYLCVPLNAQGETLGLLHLRADPGKPDPRAALESRQHLAMMIAEHVSLALSNLSLRDELRSQAIRDPLTGLFNRRYMEATLERELRRAVRHNTTVGMILFDIDRLKPINDNYGHDAGDTLLRALGELLLKTFRGEDVACRYGGDEFTVVLPEASLADIWQRAEQLRNNYKQLDLQHEGQHLDLAGLSIGVAAYPDHGATVERLIQVCDAAAYIAKAQGGDRVMIGKSIEE
jgi:diguanylate cyclase (GGDEF)-like protein